MQTNHRLIFSFLTLVLAIGVQATSNSAWAQESASAAIVAELVAEDLATPTDFSVTADGEVVFIAENGAQQIRRIEGESNEIVVSEIKTADESPESIVVAAINANQVLVGVAGFSTVEDSLCLFDLPAEDLPLNFADQRAKQSRNYLGSLKKIEAFSVLRLIRQQKGLSMACSPVDGASFLCDIYFRNGNLDKLVSLLLESDAAQFSTLTVDQMGGYLVALSKDEPNQIVFYRDDMSLTQAFPVELKNIVSLSFSPVHNRLFALVSNDSESGGWEAEGIYEIFNDGEVCKSRLVLAVPHPQILKFDEQGIGYVLSRSESDGSIGVLRKIKNLDVSPVIAQPQKEMTNED